MSRIRVAFHDPRLSSVTGGGESLTLLKIEALDRTRFEPVIVTRQGVPSPLFRQFRERNAGIEVIPVDAPSEGCPEKVISFLDKHGLGPLWGHDPLVDDALRFNTVAFPVYETLGTDLVSVSVLTDLAGLPRPIPATLHIYGCPPEHLAALEAPLLEKVRSLSAVSQFIFDAFTAIMSGHAHLPPCKILPPAISRVFLETPPASRSPGNTLLYAGRLTERKGIKRMLEAIAALQGLMSDREARLLIAGDGPRRGEWIDLAKDIGISDKVDFLGSLSSEDLVSRLDQSNFFFYPVIKPEAFGLAPLEAMARGSVPILGELGGMAEYARHGENAMVLHDSSTQSLIHTLTKALAMPEETISRMRKSCQDTANRFGLGSFARNVNQFFEDAAQE